MSASVEHGLASRRWRWLPAALLVPPLLTLGLPGAAAQTTEVFEATVIAAGDIAMCQTNGDEATAALIDSIPGTVLALGDLAYQDGSKADFDNCYAPTWGRFKDRSRPALGNHEYVQKGGDALLRLLGRAGRRPDRGLLLVRHRLVAHDRPQQQLLRRRRAAARARRWSSGCGRTWPPTRRRCILAYWHHPRFYTPSKQPTTSKLEAIDKKMQAFWVALYEAGADVVLNGHRHMYERFARQNPDGQADPNGIRQFVVGTGGGPHDRFQGSTAPNSEVRKAET